VEKDADFFCFVFIFQIQAINVATTKTNIPNQATSKACASLQSALQVGKYCNALVHVCSYRETHP